LEQASSCTRMNRCPVVFSHPNSRSSHGNHLPCPQMRLHSVSRRPISTTFSTVCLPSLRMAAACSARTGSGLAGGVFLVDIALCSWFGDQGSEKAAAPVDGRGFRIQAAVAAAASLLRLQSAAALGGGRFG